MLQVPSHDRTPWLTEAELKPRSLDTNGCLSDAIAMFQADPDLRLLPIVDCFDRPLGAIFERDVRRLLLNPFGHALLQNRTFGGDIFAHVNACPMHEMTDDIGLLIEAYRAQDGREGMILTVGERLHATLTNRRLLMLAAEDEQRAANRRLKRAERIEQAGARFEAHIASMAGQMVELADSVQQLAEATAERASVAGDQATAVVAAALQTRDSLAQLTERGNSLATAFGQVEQSVGRKRLTATVSKERVQDGAERARNLLEAARSVDQVTEMVRQIAQRVNLLSLNATIEAARSGSAGAGFAVVAREIRKLSDQAKDAARAIAAEVGIVSHGIQQVARDFNETEQAIISIAREAADIDQAVVAEADTTKVIAHSVAEAGAASATIEQAVSTIAQSVRSASSSARELDKMANKLRFNAAALGESVTELMRELRAT